MKYIYKGDFYLEYIITFYLLLDLFKINQKLRTSSEKTWVLVDELGYWFLLAIESLHLRQGKLCDQKENAHTLAKVNEWYKIRKYETKK